MRPEDVTTPDINKLIKRATGLVNLMSILIPKMDINSYLYHEVNNNTAFLRAYLQLPPKDLKTKRLFIRAITKAELIRDAISFGASFPHDDQQGLGE